MSSNWILTVRIHLENWVEHDHQDARLEALAMVENDGIGDYCAPGEFDIVSIEPEGESGDIAADAIQQAREAMELAHLRLSVMPDSVAHSRCKLLRQALAALGEVRR